MYNAELIPLIKAYQNGDKKQFQKIHEVFEKLISYYAHRLKCDDDILQELNVFLVELILRLPLDRFSMDETTGLQQYIAVSIRNRYISYSKQKQVREAMFVDYCEQLAAYGEGFDNYERRVILAEALSMLTAKQKQVIIYKYIYGYSDTEISEDLHITRQAVNRLKTRGLLILREFLKD